MGLHLRNFSKGWGKVIKVIKVTNVELTREFVLQCGIRIKTGGHSCGLATPRGREESQMPSGGYGCGGVGLAEVSDY